MKITKTELLGKLENILGTRVLGAVGTDISNFVSEVQQSSNYAAKLNESLSKLYNEDLFFFSCRYDSLYFARCSQFLNQNLHILILTTSTSSILLFNAFMTGKPHYGRTTSQSSPLLHFPNSFE